MKRWLVATVAAAALTTPVGHAESALYGTPAAVTVSAPVGATLTVDGRRTEQMTAVRHFVSPPLPAGRTFVYTLRAVYTWNGQPVARQKQVGVSAGAAVAVDMSAAEAVALPKPVEPLPQPWAVPPKDATDEPRRVPEPPAAKLNVEAQKPADKKADQKPEIEVPYVPTPEKVVAEMLKLADVKAGDVVYDLGCGDGRIVIQAVKTFGAKKGLGIDFNPERVKDSKAAAKAAGAAVESKLEFKQGDVLKMTPKDFEGVDVVTLYLLPEVNRRLKPVLQKGLKPGARVVSHDFDMGDDWKPDEKKEVVGDDGVEHTVYLWKIKEKK